MRGKMYGTLIPLQIIPRINIYVYGCLVLVAHCDLYRSGCIQLVRQYYCVLEFAYVHIYSRGVARQ